MAEHDDSFKSLADGLASNEATILQELIDCQGSAQDIGAMMCQNPHCGPRSSVSDLWDLPMVDRMPAGGYFKPDPAKAKACIQASKTLSAILGEKGSELF
eukprot:SAG25_NODE_1040_length_4198_cov_15.883407_9_plen_100_part_00